MKIFKLHACNFHPLQALCKFIFFPANCTTVHIAFWVQHQYSTQHIWQLQIENTEIRKYCCGLKPSIQCRSTAPSKLKIHCGEVKSMEQFKLGYRKFPRYPQAMSGRPVGRILLRYIQSTRVVNTDQLLLVCHRLTANSRNCFVYFASRSN